ASTRGTGPILILVEDDPPAEEPALLRVYDGYALTEPARSRLDPCRPLGPASGSVGQRWPAPPRVGSRSPRPKASIHNGAVAGRPGRLDLPGRVRRRRAGRATRLRPVADPGRRRSALTPTRCHPGAGRRAGNATR